VQHACFNVRGLNRFDQMCHKPNCGLIVHPLCCGYDSQAFSCPNCTASRWYKLPGMRYVACIVATCTGDSDDFAVWLGCVLLFASDACCINNMGTVSIIQ
jgi:hypothetical protein